jgi:molybdate transport system substrate-binding protein
MMTDMGLRNPPATRRSVLRRCLGAATVWAVSTPGEARGHATVAAASDLKFVLETLAQRFERDTRQKLTLVFGSSGNLYAQVLQGAPFHLFMSADEGFVLRLAEAGLTENRGQVYAQGRIGIIVPPSSPLKADGELQDLARALEDGRLRRFAIANPAHAPYGMRAREALQRAGLWAAISPRLVLGENVSQAAQFALSGSTQGGIIAHALALAPQVASRGQFALIPPTWHQPLVQRMVLLRDPPPAAREFQAYLSSPEARTVMQRHGFSTGGD